MKKIDEQCEAAVQLRAKLKLTHEQFAKMLGISKSLSEAWAVGTRVPDGPCMRLMAMVNVFYGATLDNFMRKYDENPAECKEHLAWLASFLPGGSRFVRKQEGVPQ